MKLHRAEKRGIKLTDVDGLVDHEVKKEIGERVEDWQRSRKGTQVHLASVRSWDDEVHHKYLCARDATGKICTMVVLAQLLVSHGFQINRIRVPRCAARSDRGKLDRPIVTHISYLIETVSSKI